MPDRTAGTAPARLFVLTTDLAGMEVSLDRASLVIGRTDENDIVLGHRSISRHHAKIVVNQRSYRIMDLKSANGTLVNGEEYAQTELKRGDLIELGHVKFRFLPPGASRGATSHVTGSSGRFPRRMTRGKRPFAVGGQVV